MSKIKDWDEHMLHHTQTHELDETTPAAIMRECERLGWDAETVHVQQIAGCWGLELERRVSVAEFKREQPEAYAREVEKVRRFAR